MQIVIDIDEETYIKANAGILGSFGEIIANGIPYEEKPQVTVFAENASKEEIEDFKKELEAVLRRPQGEWIITYSEKKKKVNKCGVCGFISIQGKTNYCPNCGADMRKGGAE